MAVPEAFKDALDIKLTPRVIEKSSGHVNHVNRDIWTQGRFFAFSDGDILYDTPAAYDKVWKDALQVISLALQVCKSRPASLDENRIGDDLAPHSIRRFEPGYLKLRVLVPNKEETRLFQSDVIECTQFQFVEFLQNGRMELIDGSSFVLVDDQE